MYKIIFQILLAIPFIIGSSLRADECNFCDEKLKHTNNTFFPIVQMVMTPCMLSQDLGMTILGEVGTKNYRIGGTLGGKLGFLSDDNWVKFSAEYLSQKLRYSFHSGQMHRWVNQYALGTSYQFFLPQCWSCSSWINTFDFNLTYSHAFSRHLRSLECPESDSTHIVTQFRNIAGGNNTHFSFGSTLLPWNCANLFVGFDYDYTSYSRKYQSNKKTSGVGGTVALHQMLTNNFAFDLEAQFRRPFNYYAADLNWTTPIESAGNLTMGIYASYTHGRDQLPNNTTIGFSIDFAFGGGPLFVYNNTCSYGPSCAPCYCSNPCDSALLAWIARPAVYMPTVLAIPDRSLVTTIIEETPSTPPTPPCVAPTSSAFPSGILQMPFDASPFFTGSGITFTVQSQNPNIVIDPVTGVVSLTSQLAQPVQFIVIGTNACGNTQQSGFAPGGD